MKLHLLYDINPSRLFCRLPWSKDFLQEQRRPTRMQLLHSMRCDLPEGTWALPSAQGCVLAHTSPINPTCPMDWVPPYSPSGSRDQYYDRRDPCETPRNGAFSERNVSKVWNERQNPQKRSFWTIRGFAKMGVFANLGFLSILGVFAKKGGDLWCMLDNGFWGPKRGGFGV